MSRLKLRYRRGRIEASLPSFPATFLFGVATADHQCEAYQSGYDDVWDDWERQHNLTRRCNATDFWQRYQEDVEKARDLGCTAFRFSIAWSRVEPSCGVYDDDAFNHYRSLIRAVRQAGMEPIVTLLHWTWPRYVQTRNGLLATDFPDTFERYAAEVVQRLGDGVRYWLTFNEPNQLVFGYVKLPWMARYPLPPGLPPGATFEEQGAAVGQLMRNLFKAHTAARAAIRRQAPAALVGANPLLLGLPGWLQRLLDYNATRQRDPSALTRHSSRLDGRIAAVGSRKMFLARLAGDRRLPRMAQPLAALSTIFTSNWWHLGMAGKLPHFLCPADCHGKQDFVGLDYYWGIGTLGLPRLRRLLNASFGEYSQAPVWPSGLHALLKTHAAMFPGQPILIIENGSVDRTDGFDRAEYLQHHIRQAQRALRDRVPLAAYICWSITSNREWGLPFGPDTDFGLYHVDLDEDQALRRVKTPAAIAYRQIINARGMSSAVAD